MERNVQLINTIADAIERDMLADDHHYDQGQWAAFAEGASFPELNVDEIVPAEPCGTAACIAGHAMLFKGLMGIKKTGWRQEPDYVLIKDFGHYQAGTSIADCAPDIGRKLLGLEKEESVILFDGDWVPPFGMTVPQYLRDVVAAGKPIEKDGCDCDYCTGEDWD